jgi:hypothetical protein
MLYIGPLQPINLPIAALWRTEPRKEVFIQEHEFILGLGLSRKK